MKNKAGKFKSIVSLLLVLMLVLPINASAVSGVLDTAIGIEKEDLGNNKIRINVRGAKDQPTSIRVYNDEKSYLFDQGVTNSEGRINFLGNIKGAEEYKVKVNLGGEVREETFSIGLDNSLVNKEELEEWIGKKVSEISNNYSSNEVNGDWVMAELGRLGIENNQASIDKQVKRLTSETGVDKKENANELLKIILALRASKIDPENFYGRNLIEELITNKDARGFYYEACGLWAINSDDYEINKKYASKIDGMVERLLGYQKDTGYFKFFMEHDDTGFALLALAPYYNGTVNYESKYSKGGEKYKDLEAAINKTLDTISKNQKEDGDICKDNGNSLISIIKGITALDSDLIWQDRFIKNGKSLFDALREKYDIDGGFKWQTSDKNPNPMATEQGFRALINYKYKNSNVFDYRSLEKKKLGDLGSEDKEEPTEKPSEGEEPTEKPGEKEELSKATINIDLLTIGEGYIVKGKEVEFKDGDNAWVVLKKLLDQESIEYEADDNNQYGSVYIRSIGGIGEFDEGPLSGWMYNVNGNYPNFGISTYILKDGDILNLRYTTNLGHDVGNGFGEEPGDTEEPGGTEEPGDIEEPNLDPNIKVIESLDGYGFKNNKVRDLVTSLKDSEFKEIKEKENVDTEKTWKLNFNKDFTEDQIEALYIEDKDLNIKKLILSKKDNKSVFVKSNFEANEDYKLKLVLKNGKKYIMRFTTK